MPYSKEAHDLLDQTFEALKTKKGQFAWAYMVGLLMPNVSLEDAKRIAEIVEGLDSDK
jgi:hypothetical protein